MSKASKLSVSSMAFQSRSPIPTKYTGDGQDVSPPLTWSGAPNRVQQWALICDDPDAPTPEPWVHWVLYSIPASVTSLPEGIKTDATLDNPKGALQGKNSWPEGRTTGYRGPAPPKGHGVHHYHFKVYALDTALSLKPGLSKPELFKAIEPHVLANGELIGTYERK